ncbi:hypothetical protein [Roseococcus sp.]|uniref:hypothetical protein n=1 Tax=Roseococcus sp. TaxID=2109646 RepID=UPI003BAD40EC
MSVPFGPDPEAGVGRAALLRCTFGIYNQTTPWTDSREMPWPKLATLLTTHELGPKEGTCIVPAAFRGIHRNKKDASRIEVVMLDSDSGATLDEIVAAIGLLGLAAVVSSTHSHLNTETRVKRGAFETWVLKNELNDDPGAAEAFLAQEKGMLLRVAKGATITAQDETFVTVSHQPCPKFRIALPLARPWVAAAYETQAQAAKAWERQYAALAHALRLQHDISCSDVSRLFFLPRRSADGPPVETQILEGDWCDIFALDPPEPEGPSANSSKRGRRQAGSAAPGSRKATQPDQDRSGIDFGLSPDLSYSDADTGEILDLRKWARKSGRHFQIVPALKSRSPQLFVGKVAGDVRHHILCPNADAHTGTDPDAATFICNPGAGESDGFVIHCRHAHCNDRDRLVFLRQLLEQKSLTIDDLQSAKFQPTAPPPKPLIRVTGGNLPEVVQHAEQALIGPPHGAYQRGSFLVRPGLIRLGVGDAVARTSLQIIELEDQALAEAMTLCAHWQRFDGRSNEWVDIDAPTKVATVLLQRRGRWQLPVLAGILSAPTLRADGTVLDQPGYDPATGLLLATRKTHFPVIPDQPSHADAKVALDRLIDLIATFPFVDDASRSVALSGLLTASIRRSLRTAPLHGYTAPVAGSGKSMLVDLCSIIATGRVAGVIAQGRTEEELEKRLGALLLNGEQVIAIDNCETPLGGEFLCSLITQEFVRCRILGRSEAPELPCNSFLTATGNNLTLLGDMTRRTVLSQLDPHVERPELRAFDRDPLREAHLHRPELLVSALTVLRAYHVAGYPNAPTPLGSFETWSTWVRGALLWLGRADPVLTMETVRAQDPRLESLVTVIEHWHQSLGASAVTVREIIACASEQRTGPGGSIGYPRLEFVRPDFREALLVVAGDNGAINSRRLGRWIGDHHARVVSNLRIARAPMQSGNQRWKLEMEESHAAAA